METMVFGEPQLQFRTTDPVLLTASNLVQATHVSPTFGKCCRFPDSRHSEQRKALRLPRVNLFIADDVGLGKTIEAGLIARELLLRKKVQDIVVACPPSMLLQWQEELEDRFGLVFQILDKD